MKNAKYYVRVCGDRLLGMEIGEEEYNTSSIRKIRKSLKEMLGDRWKVALDVCSNETGVVLFTYDKCRQVYVDNDFTKQASKILR